MSEKMTCDSCRELLPLLYARALSDQDEDMVRDHLKGCPECREFLRQERALYVAARVTGSLSPLADHPASQQLDRYVREKGSFSSKELREIESHLSGCTLCSELVANLGHLPAELDDLVTDEQLPLLSRLEVESKPRAGMFEISRALFWRPLMGYAAAAAILLVVLLTQRTSTPPTVPTVSGTISASSRGDDHPATFFSSGETCHLVLKYFVDPEPGHRYDFEIKPEEAGRPSLVIYGYQDFDPQGNAILKTLLEVGRYRLIISDIGGKDTVRIVKSFELKTPE